VVTGRIGGLGCIVGEGACLGGRGARPTRGRDGRDTIEGARDTTGDTGLARFISKHAAFGSFDGFFAWRRRIVHRGKPGCGRLAISLDNVLVGHGSERIVRKEQSHHLRDDLRIDDSANLGLGADPDVFSRQLFAEILVGLVLVSQAAHKPAAPARNLGRVQRGLLDLCHSHGDGL
jgi:hypothetical protein